MDNADDILNKAVDSLKNQQGGRVPEEVLKKTEHWLAAAQTNNSFFRLFVKPSLAAAIVLIGAFAIMYFFIMSINESSVAWADVQHCINRITFAHCFNSQKNDTEAWYIDGVLYIQENNKIARDDGKKKSVYDIQGELLSENPSDMGDMLGENVSPFEILTQGVFEYDSNDVNSKVPVYIGDDLLIYKFEAPKSMKNWASGLIITAGRQSKLPIYIKIVPKDSTQQRDIFIFDYEKQEVPEVITKISICQ
ncbi:MAG: hypothetical protein ABFD79_18795 [Phycisphaerales bacterium]